MIKSTQNIVQRKLFIIGVLTLVSLLCFVFFARYTSRPGLKSGTITREEAIAKIKIQPEVVDYLKIVPEAKIEADHEDNNSYSIHVYEIKDGHTATFNWFTVDKTSGEVEKQF